MDGITARSLVLHIGADPRGGWQFTSLADLPHQNML